ncbi:ATP-binding protein [Anatilimnocola sp. NA78]|uniref:ATP-binding protein n=1 Tax=Anatilimnocola sp. NA78 TaxID=3415683 RepID=UPI003CE45070
MTDSARPTDDLQAFEQADLALRLQRGTIGLALGVLMMPAGVILDLNADPDGWGKLLAVRLVTTAILAIGLAVFMLVPLGRAVKYASLGLVLFPALAIALMIYLIDKPNSNYFVGLTLLMLLIQLLGFSALEAGLYCGMVMLAFFLATFSKHGFHAGIDNLPLETFFLLATTAISVVVCHLNLRNRRTDFLLRRTLDEKNRQLEELDRLRAGFLANVSHELRTPLSLIIAPIEEILSTRQTVTPQMGHTLTLVRKNADRLRLLVDDLLDVVRLDHGVMRLEIEEVDARDFLLQIVRTLEPMAEDRQIKLVSELQTTPMDLRLDISRVERVLMNLITNSIKFSPEKSTIRVQLEARERAAAIIVSDQGPGIPEADRVQIFDRFFQASNNRARASQGLGLGLAIAREIVRAHGGEIEAHNNPERGCRFVVTLPLEWNPADYSPAQRLAIKQAGDEATSVRLSTRVIPSVEEVTADAVALAAARVIKEGPQELLIVDDEPDLRNYLVESLQSEFATASAATCAQGLQKAKELKPACILLDLMLPDGSGIDVLRAIRAEPSLCDTKVVMLTANLDETVKIDALRFGADDFLSKPFGITEVRTRVAGLIRSSHLQGQLRREREELQQSLVRLRETEVKLFQSEKMRGLGSLAAGLLHEINNPVHYTLLAIRSLKKDLAAGRDTSEVVADIESGVTRVGQILGELRNFAYPEQAQLQLEFKLYEVLQSALRFTAHLTKNLSLEVADDFRHIKVQGSQIQIGQVLVNLLTNATTALEKLGESHAGKITITGTVNGDRFQLRIVDNGPGIPSADLTRVTEPFYTTAAPGSGLGLGLSICDTIIRNHGGYLVLQSAERQGTEVSFDLPLVPSEGKQHATSPHEANPVRR